MLREKHNAAAAKYIPGDIVDAVFAISCRSLPVDHAYALSQAIQEALPWFAEEPGAGLHLIYGAASASGWMRPERPDALLQLSHRAKLTLRLPRHRLDDATALLGRTLQVAGWPLRVDKVAMRPLSRITTLFSRCVVLAAAGDEASFLAAAAGELEALGISSPRLLCGRVTPIATPARIYRARSLMLAGLTPAHSLALQRHGLGAERKLGCGLFIPHKDIADLRSRPE
ncbi:MAG: type I-MYXAN CRISPR-associated protein Cas6/Cmx6 [Betaproteobacteria bacterium]|nr:type I-MYXAN CRISPR-associated protein Cas6/Cmx6 [Betaproteobacteria bacterium]